MILKLDRWIQRSRSFDIAPGRACELVVFVNWARAGRGAYHREAGEDVYNIME